MAMFCKNVRNWAWNARGAIQEPVLLPGRPGRGRARPRPTGARRPRSIWPRSRSHPAPAAPQPGSCRAGRAMAALPGARWAGSPSLGLLAAPLARVSRDARPQGGADSLRRHAGSAPAPGREAQHPRELAARRTLPDEASGIGPEQPGHERGPGRGDRSRADRSAGVPAVLEPSPRRRPVERLE